MIVRSIWKTNAEDDNISITGVEKEKQEPMKLTPKEKQPS